MELHQLDVKTDSRKARRVRRTRKAAWLIKFAAIAVMILSASASVRWVYRQIFYENSEFRLNRLQIHTDGVLTEAELATAARVELGMNLMEIDLNEVRGQLGKLPMVTNAEVVREMPDRLEIRVKERVPVAWLSCPPPWGAAAEYGPRVPGRRGWPGVSLSQIDHAIHGPASDRNDADAKTGRGHSDRI